MPKIYGIENGANCVAAAAAGGGSSVWTDNTSHASFGGFHVLKAGQALPATFDDDGARAFYYHDKEAFRGGEITGGNGAWQQANIGPRSFAWGRNVKASNQFGTAMGRLQQPLASKAPRWGTTQPPLALSAPRWGATQPPLATAAPRWGTVQPPHSPQAPRWGA